LEALVKKPRLIVEKGLATNLRAGRGFSKLELKEVGLSLKRARSLGIPIDPRRRSKHEWNIRNLKQFLSTKH